MPLRLLASLVVLTAAAWALTLYQTVSMDMPMGIAVRGGMEGMEGMAGMAMDGIAADGWSLGGRGAFVAVWTVMMAAMMLPAAAPMILMFAAAQARRERHVAVPTWMFVAGYMLVWAAAGSRLCPGPDRQRRLRRASIRAQRSKWAPLALGATLCVAGLYQFTTIKHICLSHCRSPLAFVAQHWRDGRVGALQHGAAPRALLLWLLLGIVCRAGRGRRHERRLDAAADAGRLRREAAAARPPLRRASALAVVLGVAVASGSALMLWLAAGDGGPG